MMNTHASLQNLYRDYWNKSQHVNLLVFDAVVEALGFGYLLMWLLPKSTVFWQVVWRSWM
jgi:hypothetical protein